MVTLVSEDGIKFPVSMSVLRCIGVFKTLIELHQSSALPQLPVAHVNSLILAKIIDYLKSYVESRQMHLALSGPAAAAAKPVTRRTTGHVTDDDDEEDEDEDEAGGEAAAAPGEAPALQVELLSDDDDAFRDLLDDSNLFDFASFDERSLRVFSPFEQHFFASLDIPTLIEVTKVGTGGRACAPFSQCRRPIT